MADIRLQNVVKIYGVSKKEKPRRRLLLKEKALPAKRAIDDVTLAIPHGSFTVLVGPSGCGKTTLLRMIAGLEEITGGRIMMGDIDITNLEPGDRGLAMVFQNYALYQHMTVRENIEFGLLNARVPRFEIRERVDHALEVVGLTELAMRKPARMSGGQRQRVALARAIAKYPECFLMDEPLSNLDAKLRVQLRGELKEMQKNFGITTVYVTHDQEEALTLSDCIAVFNNGVIEQIGAPNEIYNHSKTEFVCNFIGDINKVQPQLLSEIAAQTGATLDPKKASYVRLERVHVNMPAASGFASFKAKVVSREYYGLYIKYTLSLCGQTVKSIEKNDGTKYFETGEEVSVFIKPDDLMVY